MRKRLRPAYNADELALIYPQPHKHTAWPDHILRVDVTAQIGRWMSKGGPVADLSCGDGACARQIGGDLVLGDLAPGYPICGPIEETIEQIGQVDLFLLCETLEHLDDPDAVLAQIRPRTRALVLSTPDGEENAGNPEHYWGWDTDGVREMLARASFEPAVLNVLSLPAFKVRYQIWGCT